MKKTPFVFAVLFLFFNALSAQSLDSSSSKNLAFEKKYMFSICKGNKANCLGYGPAPMGPNGQICAIVIQEDSVIVIDSYFKNLKKINLKNGEIVKESEILKDEGIGSLSEILLYDKAILLLSQTSPIYVINSDLDLTDVLKIPLLGYSYKFYFFKDNLYALSGKTISSKKDSIEKVAFKINSDFSLSMDTIKLNHDEYWVDTLLYGGKVQMFENNGKCYLKADSVNYEIPEIIPQFDFYHHAVGYNEKYLVYFVFLETHYEMVVCCYE